MDDLREEGVDTKALYDYVTLIVIDTNFRIKRPPIPTNIYKVKPIIIQMIQTNQFSDA